MLRTDGNTPEEEVVKVASDWRTATLDSQERAMLAFAEKLTFSPGLIDDADLDQLRHVGFSEPQIVAITLASAYRNFITRIADLLGVEAGDREIPDAIYKAFGVTREQARVTLHLSKEQAAGRAR